MLLKKHKKATIFLSDKACHDKIQIFQIKIGKSGFQLRKVEKGVYISIHLAEEELFNFVLIAVLLE